MVLADDKVDNVVAVAVNVQVVDGGVVAAVAVDVAGVAVGDDAAGVGLADVETGVGAVEDLVVDETKSATSSQGSKPLAGHVSLTPLCTLLPRSYVRLATWVGSPKMATATTMMAGKPSR